MQIYMIKQNNHLNYILVEVIQETKTRYKTAYGWHNKNEVYFREIDVINALIAKKTEYILLYKDIILNEKQFIINLIERKKWKH